MQLYSKFGWEAVEDLPHLLVNSSGIIFSKKYNRELKGNLIGKKSKYVAISYRDSNKKVKHLKIHKLVAKAFIPNPENKPCVNHKDGNKLNNNVLNLEWVTHQENCYHAVDTGLNPKRGELNHNSKISNASIPLLKSLYASGLKQKQIAEMYKVTQSAISRIITNLTYKTIKP